LGVQKVVIDLCGVCGKNQMGSKSSFRARRTYEVSEVSIQKRKFNFEFGAL
jgi:hypothetical protein